jgi:hypothetical protein
VSVKPYAQEYDHSYFSSQIKNVSQKTWQNWSSYEKIVTKRALKIISEGAITHTKYNLLPIRAKNCQSSFIFGKEMTDTIAFWISKNL